MFVSTVLLSANKTSIFVKIQVKIEESERGWQSPGVWLEPLVLCHWATTTGPCAVHIADCEDWWLSSCRQPDPVQYRRLWGLVVVWLSLFTFLHLCLITSNLNSKWAEWSRTMYVMNSQYTTAYTIFILILAWRSTQWQTNYRGHSPAVNLSMGCSDVAW